MASDCLLTGYQALHSGAEVAAYQASRAAVSALTQKLSSELPLPMLAVELDPGVTRGLLLG